MIPAHHGAVMIAAGQIRREWRNQTADLAAPVNSLSESLSRSVHRDLPRFSKLQFRHIDLQDALAISRLDSILLNGLGQIERS